MTFSITKPNETAVTLARKIGYTPSGVNDENEYSLVRPVGGGRKGYPRFHIYVKKEEDRGVFNINLHLDQKQPSYGDNTAHSGEYEGDIIDKEADESEFPVLDNCYRILMTRSVHWADELDIVLISSIWTTRDSYRVVQDALGVDPLRKRLARDLLWYFSPDVIIVPLWDMSAGEVKDIIKEAK